MNILVIGSGPIAIDYAIVLNNLKVKYSIFQRLSSNNIIPKNINVIKKNSMHDLDLSDFTHIINCVDLENQAKINLFILQNSNAYILSEKPGFINQNDYLKVIQNFDEIDNRFFVAYNRRFFESIIKLKELCKIDGGITSMHFDFTEWQKSVDETRISTKLKEKWAILNSSHVIDLAFYISGRPSFINSHYSSSLKWHPSSAIMKGYGITVLGVPFSYSSDWSSAGRWDIQIYTKKRKFILSPLEKLKYVSKETIDIKEIEILEEKKFKNGFYKQVKSFLFQKSNNIPNFKESYDLNKIIFKICGYE